MSTRGRVAMLGLAALCLLAWLRVLRLGETIDILENEVARLRHDYDASQQAATPLSPLLLDYRLDVPGRGEVFPAMASTHSPAYWPLATLRITNTAPRAQAQTVVAEIPGWSRRDQQSLVVGPRETRQVLIQPELLPRAHENDEIRSAVLEVLAQDAEGGVLFADSHPVLIHGGAEIYWGRRFANAQTAARWVTPHDPAVLELVSRARRYMPRGRLAGYAGGSPATTERHVRAQAAALFRVLQGSGLSYVNSLFVMGNYVDTAQRIRLPSETLRLANANCMDVSVAFASALENLGLQPLLVIVPQHAFAGVRLRRDSQDVLYLDLTVLPKGSFASAAARARRWLEKTPIDRVLTVDVAAARALGIYPLSARPAREPEALGAPSAPAPSPQP